MNIKTWVVVACAALVSACGTSNSYWRFTPPAADQPGGYIVGMVGGIEKGSTVNYYGLVFCDDKGNGLFDVSYNRTRAVFDDRALKDGDFSGNPFAVRVAPGTYDICDVMLGEGNRSVRLVKRFSQRITIEAGKANYIGRYMGVPAFGETWLGGKALESARWYVFDRQATDMQRVQRYFPETAPLPVTNAVPPPEKLVRPIFWPGPQ